MSTRELEDVLVTTIESPVIYPALLFDLKFGGYAPPVTPAPGEYVAWSFPTTCTAGSKDLGATNGSATANLSGGRITFTHGAPLGNYAWYCSWGGFSQPVVSPDATITAIYPVLIVSRKNGGTFLECAGGTGINLGFAGLNADNAGEYISFSGDNFEATESHSSSLGTDLTVLDSSTIVASCWRSLSGACNEEVTISGVGFAVYYTDSLPVGIEPQPDGGNVYHVWSGIGTLIVNGTSYLGVGSLGNVTTVAEGTGVEAKGITLTLSGIDPIWLAESMTEINLASRAKVWLAFLNPAATSMETLVIGDPIQLFTGIMDGPQIDMDTKTATISIDVESKLVDLNRSRGGRYTDQDQHGRYPGDNCLQYASYNQDRNIIWKS